MKYLFKRAADGVIICGDTDKSVYPFPLWIDPQAGNIVHFRQSDASPFELGVDITTVKKENGEFYADIADFNSVSGTFFFKLASINSATGMVLPDPDTAFKFRIIMRGSAICFDKELTATGFAGVQDVDWKETGSFGSDV